MTAGSLPLILILLALVVAATDYSVGRLHQWWRAGEDRDEAYREGYDSATRSAFSVAARMIGSRRPPARGSAVVRTAAADDGVITAPMPSAPDASLRTPCPTPPTSSPGVGASGSAALSAAVGDMSPSGAFVLEP